MLVKLEGEFSRPKVFLGVLCLEGEGFALENPC